MTKLCVVCGTEGEVTVDGRTFCLDCYSADDPLPVIRWDTLTRPEYIAGLERRLETVERILKEWTGDK